MDAGKLGELSEHRICRECGAEFRMRSEDGRTIPALEQFSDHLTTHQPTPGQWTEAYNKIREGREREKRSG
jgi:hypothetical protein